MIEHTDVAAYSLGLLDPDERLEFEAHLAGCQSCAADLAEFSGMADLLAGVEPVEVGQVEPDDAAVVGLMNRRASARRHRVRHRLVLAAAASVVLLAGGVGVGIVTAPARSGLQLIGQLHTATDRVTGVSGTVGLVAKPYGTQITLDLAGVHGPYLCQLVAVSKTGQRAVVGGWLVPAAGYGVPGHPAHLIVAGATAIMSQNLSRVDVDFVGGRTLLSIRV